MTAHGRYSRNPDVAAREIDGEYLLIPIRRQLDAPVQLMVMNKVAAVIWEGLETPTGSSALVRKVVERFEVESSRAEQDVSAFLERMVHLGLVVPEESR